MEVNAMESAMSDLGISPDSLDASDLEMSEAGSMEAEGEAIEEVEASADENDGEEVEQSIEGEENQEEPIVQEDEQAEEAPKLTAKEIQEIEQGKKELALKEAALSEKYAAKEKEFQAQYSEKLREHDEFDQFLSSLANKDPELFDIFKGEFQDFKKSFSNPVVEAQNKEIHALKSRLDSFMDQTSDQVTITKMNSEIEGLKNTIGKEFEEAGLKLDWEQVKEVWADNPKLSMEAAVFALYGKNFVKASVSKTKVATAIKKVEARPKVATAGSVSKSTSTSEVNVSNLSASDRIRYFANKLTKN